MRKRRDQDFYVVRQLPTSTGRAREMYSTIKNKKNANLHLMSSPNKNQEPPPFFCSNEKLQENNS